ncbi:MAG: bifunctional 5,10-methylenetetrahydrofolate dehydrogenase/5,10-methenyltetrahydrofolate cyclohydrolase [Candidatus Delongbacteria bacterium]|nr:bifunctional 5,10-methylenetetrahydrofolate dehydrogenase/5,10-methenyltetrahydrofolate cyclohydrolase [Candidatus Delongbacteria bacterium]MCG2761531.1 bifunctional 5,10-methylenetetrahydrofolate dehydrogenase/5,10-methenyltetrahydrofolate cyclohydrolase [Candidatus Delongbacteria bacterium]
MAELLKGNPIAKVLYSDFRRRTDEFRKAGIITKINIMIASNDTAVETYSSMIIKNCEKAGIECEIRRFDYGATTEDILIEVGNANSNKSIHGLIVMLPLSKNIDERKVLASISPVKDIDGVNPYNAGKTVLGDDSFTPNTAQACKDILVKSGIDISGKHVVIIGRSNIVGKPLANMLIQKGVDATVTVCHSRTRNLKDICRSADIIVAAIGSPLFIKKDFTNSEQIIIDVGMNEMKNPDGSIKLVGDVDFEGVKDFVKAITPVPGGVSPLTHTALIGNILKAVDLQLIEQSR